jgi:transposase-like protein
MKKTFRRYGEAFKRQVVLEYESGVSVNALKKKYGIGGSETINLWIKKYAKDGFRHDLIRIQSTNEIDQIKALEGHIEELERTLGKVTLEKLKLESIVEELEASHSIEIKKNEVQSFNGSVPKPKNLNGR